MTLCILQGRVDPDHSSFIRAHVEYLAGDKVTLTGFYPDLAYNGRQIRYFQSRHPLRKKLQKLLPHWLYHRRVTLWEETYAGRHDAIAGFMRAHGVDVILAEFGIHGSNITPHARDLGIPLIVHFHGHDVHRAPLLEDFRDRYRVMFDYACRLVSVSHHMTAQLVEMGADPAKIVYNPYGPREFFYENEPDYSPTMVAIGRFTDIKAPHLTLLAFHRVAQQYPQARLTMGGHGELLEACKTLAGSLGLGSRVDFPGVLRHEEVLRLMAYGCCFVQHSVTPTYGDAEGTPVAILEAGAAGLPVVATRHGGITEAVVDGTTGLLVDERDIDGMTTAMGRLLADPELCRRMGAAARKHIRSHYSIERHIACLDRLIAEARTGG